MKRKEVELLLVASLESEKKERQRIAADIHDGVSCDLNTINNFIAALQKGESDPKRRGLFVEIRTGIEAAIESTRQISYKLMPPLLETRGFVIALEEYFINLTQKTTVNFTIKSPDEFPGFTSIVAYELFRVIQEFCTNMLKYGNIQSCSVTLSVTKEATFLEIIDDGQPYDFQSLLTTSTGTGIKNINSRLKSIEADLQQRQAANGNHFIITLKNP